MCPGLRLIEIGYDILPEKMVFWGLIIMPKVILYGIDDEKSALSQCAISQT
ncbi:MAG: hypothetical protein RID09_16320 [Coleofasciculus sp. G1-WW12-02]